MLRRRRRSRRSSRSPSADDPRSVSPGKGAKDCDVEIAPLLQVPRPWPLKHVLVETAVIVLTTASAAGVLLWLQGGLDSGSAAGLPVAWTQEWPWNAAHEKLGAMLGKSLLDTPSSDHSVVDDSAEDVMKSTGSALQAAMQKERTLASSPDFFFSNGAAGVNTQSGDDTRSSGESSARVSVMGSGLPSTHESDEIPDEAIEPTCATRALSWMHVNGQTPVKEEPTDPAGSTLHQPSEVLDRAIEPTCATRAMSPMHVDGQTPVAEEPTDPAGPTSHQPSKISERVIAPICATRTMTWMHVNAQTPVAEEPTDPAGPTSHQPSEISEKVIEPTCASRTMTWMHSDGQTPVAEEPTESAGSTSAVPDERVLSMPADVPTTMSAGQATEGPGNLKHSAAPTVGTSSFLPNPVGVEEEGTVGGAEQEVRESHSTGSVPSFSLAATPETDTCPVEIFQPHLPMCSRAPFQAVTVPVVPLDVNTAPPDVLPESPSFPARDLVIVQEDPAAALSATTEILGQPDKPAESLVLVATPASLTEQVTGSTTIDNPFRSSTPEDFACPLLRESPLEGTEVITPALLSSATETEHTSQRATAESTTSVAGTKILPSGPPLESTDCRLRTPAELEPWIGMLTCTATFPDVITMRTEAEMMAAPFCPTEDVQTAAVTAEDELPLEAQPFWTAANVRRFSANFKRAIPKFPSSEKSTPSFPASAHETTTNIEDLDGASHSEDEVVLELPGNSVAAFLDTKATEAEVAGEPARCPRVVLEAPFYGATDFPERTPTEVEEGAQWTCPLSAQQGEPTAAGRGQDKAMPSDKVTFKTHRSSAALSESITAGGETCGALAQFLRPRHEAAVPSHALPTCPATLWGVICAEKCTETVYSCSFPAESGPTILVGRATPRERPTCQSTLLGVICAERGIEPVYPCSCSAEDGPTAVVGNAVEMTNDPDALPYRPGATAGISPTRAGAEARSTTSDLAERGRTDAEMSVNDKKVDTLSCPTGVPLANLVGEQMDVCPFLLEDTPEAAGMLADGVSLFGTLPAWATGLPVTCTADNVVGEESAPHLPIKGVATTSQAYGDAGTQGETSSCAATVPDFFVSQTELEDIPRYHQLTESAAMAAGELRYQTNLAAVEPSSSSHGTDQEMLMDSAKYLVDNMAASSTAAGDKERGEDQEHGEFQDSTTDSQDELDMPEAMKEVAKLKCEQHKKGLEDDKLRLEMLVREFNLWIRSINFPVRKVEAGVVAGGMRAGLVATESLADGEPYLLVPESITLDASKAQEDPELGPPLAKIRTHLSPIGLWDDELDSLRVLLIAETYVRADRSFWAPYLRLLPTLSDMMSYHPLFFGYSAIASFEGSDVQASLRMRRFSEVEAFNSKFVDDVSAVRELEEVLGEGWITLDRYLWASAILDSRMIWWDGRKHLVPLLDLVNNAQGPPGTAVQETLEDAEGNAVATTTQSFETGTQVMENYGHANHVLVLYHGFSLGRENRYDCVWIAPTRLPRGPGHGLMLARMREAFPGGRPSFCISLDKHGPYDFVSYARIAAGLPAFPSPPPVEGEPFPSRGVDEPACQWAAEGICEEVSGGCFEECSEESSVKQPVEPSVHERWEDLRHDSEGLRAVVTYLEMRLSKYPQWGSDGGDGECSGGDGGSCAGSGGRSVEVATDNDYGACGITTVEEETRKFLDSEQHLLQEIFDYLVPFVPRSSPPKNGHQNDKAVAGNYSREDASGNVDKRSGYDDGKNQADPLN